MSTFEETRKKFDQRHFSIIEIDLPIVEGACTISGEPGYGTPLTCDQPTTGIKTYKFTTIDAPILPESGILRLVESINETPTKLQSGKGLASRGTISIKFRDDKKDPNPFSPAVAQGLAEFGTYFGKLAARNVLSNKNVRIKNYRVEDNGAIDLQNGAETRHYIIESFNGNSKGFWMLKGKDELSKINIDESVWPIPLNGSLRTNINENQLNIPVDSSVQYAIKDCIRIGDELIKVLNVSGIGTGNAAISTAERGQDITYTNFLSTTQSESHDINDEVFVCDVSDNERIDDFLERVLIDVGVDPSFIPKSDWKKEIDEWHPNNRINTIWIESQDTVEVIESILKYFMIDMWFDPVDRKIKISAISVWRQSDISLSENNEIDYESIQVKKREDLRATRALVVYDKRNLTSTDSIENYNKASLYSRLELETEDFYGKPKTSRLGNTKVLSKDAADLLTNRLVNRFLDPEEFSWTTQERKRDFYVGQVADITSSIKVGFNGLPSGTSRAQITSITPMYKREGREYKVTALSYEPVFENNSEIVIQGNISDINLYIQYAGAPSDPVELTFVLDGVVSSSTSENIPSIRSGNFPAGSKIILILANGADLMAKSGDGGNGQSLIINSKGIARPDGVAGSGGNGGVVIDAEGVDMDIYFSGPTPSANYPDANGFIRAPSGGSGGFNIFISEISVQLSRSGDGGNSGDGRIVGLPGNAGNVTGDGENGRSGDSGTDNPSTGSYGQDGDPNDAGAGSKGSGVIDSGATVTFFGSDANRYINGNGDHP